MSHFPPIRMLSCAHCWHYSLGNHGLDDEVNAMFDLGAQTFALPSEEKMPYQYQGDGSSFGYVCLAPLPYHAC